jgi:23S rRNA (uridine2552-2'-O)-methyltransferase
VSKRSRLSNPYKRPDRFTVKAKDEGFSARSVFKLEEIERRFRVLPRGGRVLDLGCAPGSWSEFVARKGGGNTRLVGIDIQAVERFPGTFLQRSISDIGPAELQALLGGPADLVLSDMAPFTTGNRLTDHVRQLELARLAFDCALQILKPGGNFVVKLFDGEEVQDFVLRVNRSFAKARRVRPEATRENSVEFFLVCLDFKG